VLAGDHMQLDPEVVSAFAQEKRLNLSLLGNTNSISQLILFAGSPVFIKVPASVTIYFFFQSI
jgi:hypothetical protein